MSDAALQELRDWSEEFADIGLADDRAEMHI
jgi:hypothetical protein